jgi:hypothetical protein
MKKSNHFPISEAEAIELFQPQNLKLPETNKISKTVINKTRWQSRDANAQRIGLIFVLESLDLKYLIMTP